MLRSAAILNRTEVQPIRKMKQPTTRQFLPMPTASGRSRTLTPTPKMRRKLTIDVRLFKV